MIRLIRPGGPLRGGAAPGDEGTASLELVILTPFLVLLLLLTILFGRYAQTENVIDQAARDSARAATAQNSKQQVPQVVRRVMQDTLRSAPSSCASSARPTIEMTPNAFGLPDLANLQAVDSVTVRVTCRLDLSDLAPLPLSTVDLHRTFTSPLDRYRGYQ